MKFPRFAFRGWPAQVASWPLPRRTPISTRVLGDTLAVSLAVLIAGWFAVAPVRDAATLQGVPRSTSSDPTPTSTSRRSRTCSIASRLLSERQHVAVLLGLVVMWGLCRFARPGGMRQNWRESMRSFAALVDVDRRGIRAAAYLPRPMAHLASLDPDVLRIDFHSHTQSSKDARRSYSIERNRAWHHAGGYDVAYVTDHDTFAGAEQGLANDPSPGTTARFFCEGIEVSWKGEHIGLLGEERSESLRAVGQSS